MNTKDLLTDLNKENQSVQKEIEFFADMRKATRTTAAIVSHHSDQLVVYITMLRNEIQSLRDELASLYDYTEEDVGDLIDLINSKINTNTKALKASMFYNKEWFRNMPYSDATKSHIASSIINLISKFNPSYVPDLWRSIAEMDPEVMRNISYSKSDKDTAARTGLQDNDEGV